MCIVIIFSVSKYHNDKYHKEKIVDVYRYDILKQKIFSKFKYESVNVIRII